jgi:hypothetical protein
MHPLVDDLADLKDPELENKILDLSKKYWQTRNSNVQHQIRMLLDVYNDELRNRRSKLLQQQLENRNQDLDKLIKVN